MPCLQAFPHCCGCDIISTFEETPSTVIAWKRDPNNVDRWGNAIILKDEKGNNIPLKTAKEGLIELIGTKSSWGDTKALPDRGFVCILAERQLEEWMPVLKEIGFTYLCQWNNSVHGKSPNYLFAMVKQNGSEEPVPAHQPPAGWTDLPDPDPEVVKELYAVKPEYLNEEMLDDLDADEDLLVELDDPFY